MGRAFEVITGFTTAASTTVTALTMGTGDSLTVKNAPLGSDVWLLQVWSQHSSKAMIRIRSPKLHDNVQGIRLATISQNPYPLLPWGFKQKLFPQDALVVEQTGSATAGAIETTSLLIYYSDLPGQDARLISPEEVMRRMVNIVTIENTLALGTAGGYSGSEAINAEFDVLKANTDYALLGYLCDASTATVGWKGPDTGNLRVGGPGHISIPTQTSDWFVRLSRVYGIPMIPVINMANKGATNIDGAQDDGGVDPKIIHIYAELGIPR